MTLLKTLFVYILICTLLTGCQKNPATGKRQLALVSEEQEIELGRQSAEQVRRSLGLVENDALQAYVQRVGSALAARSERPKLPWSFQVVDDPTPNAFALPGGFIFVTRGMMGYMDSEAELAAVLGHEIAHVTARHSIEQISRAQLAQLGLGIGMVLFPEMQQYGGVLSSGLELLFLKYGRDAERQADELGFDYALAERYDVREMDDIFATLQRIATQEGRSPLPTWAASHPDPGERIQSVQTRLDKLGPQLENLQLGRAELMTHIDGLEWGENPRHGYFQGSVFLHPELAFRMTFPEGWRLQNLPQAVIAIAPAQAAAIQLTLARAEPSQAARQFASQNGVQAGEIESQILNGLPAVLVHFAGQSQQGAMQGIAAFVAYKDQTYQAVGFGSAARYPELERPIRRAIESFAPLTDSQALAVRSRVLDVINIPKPLSIAELAKAYPSVVDLDTLALINQQPDANTALPAGTLAKRVIQKR